MYFLMQVIKYCRSKQIAFLFEQFNPMLWTHALLIVDIYELYKSHFIKNLHALTIQVA